MNFHLSPSQRLILIDLARSMMQEPEVSGWVDWNGYKLEVRSLSVQFLKDSKEDCRRDRL